MRVLVTNLSDSASVNIRDHLVALGSWEVSSMEFRGRPVLARPEALLVEVDGPTITDEALAADLHATNLPIRDVWFLSRHRAASGKPSFTVHPTGNWKTAEYGGQPGQLSVAAPRDMGALLRCMEVAARAANLPHEVTYEATHHGPLMDIPCLFVEIGSDETWYEDKASGEAMASAIEMVLSGEGRCTGPIAVGVGGGHYVPQQTGKALAGEFDFGHLLPAYGLDDEKSLQLAWDATPDAAGIWMHKKGLKGPQRQIVRDWAEANGVAIL